MITSMGGTKYNVESRANRSVPDPLLNDKLNGSSLPNTLVINSWIKEAAFTFCAAASLGKSPLFKPEISYVLILKQCLS